MYRVRLLKVVRIAGREVWGGDKTFGGMEFELKKRDISTTHLGCHSLLQGKVLSA